MREIRYNKDSKELAYLKSKDPKLNSLFNMDKEIVIHLSDDYFVSLVSTILAQQLSTKVATVIFNRLRNLCDNVITAEKILAFTEEELKSVGLSYQKVKYLKSLATCHLDQTIKLDQLDHLTNEEIIDMLIEIKGIGVWSAQMFLMFSLGREDVFSVLDLGLRNALKKVYQDPDLTHQEIEKISENWKPYRSIVSHYLWHAWDQDTK